ncbi:uncharacterized protein E0L32_008257 [Thyridium curvatum]|uniref:Uncharacterized protein n=1 Tax=Thyridium curvatum TaxID=1093900 RepID=A0A507B1L4_9PEZI|nr:uncharacterized protein E0L32_008257 [Thyridium curvatum]TPX10868.1 hypothetical protein E0L32_008257 [Thyridium curvatum]
MQRLTRISSIRGLARDPPPPQKQQCSALHMEHRRRRRRLGRGAPLRNTSRLFELPNIVLDLDAEDNPHVRPYNDADEEAQVAKWSSNPDHASLLLRQRSFSSEAHQAKRILTSTVHNPTPWRVTDQDLLSAALLSSTPSASTTSGLQNPAAVFDQLLYYNGVAHRMSNDGAKMVHTLLHRQSIARELDHELHEPEYRKALMGCNGFEQVRRMLTELLQTSDGCLLLSRCARDVRQRLAVFLEDKSKDYVSKILVLLNNISSTFAAKSVPLPLPLCGIGLQAASIAGELAAVQRYLGTALEEGINGQAKERRTTATRVVGPALETLLRNTRDRDPSALQAACKGTRTDLYTLLTGRSLSGCAIKPSFRATLWPLNYGSSVYAPYLALLGELGAVRTLWHEYRRMPARVKAVGNEAHQQRLDVLVAAVLRHAEPLTEGSATDEQGVFMCGDESSDSKLDLQRLSMRDQQDASRSLAPGTLLTLRTPVREAAPTLPDPRADQQFRDGVQHAFEQPQANVAMEALTSLCASPYVDKWRSTMEHRPEILAAESCEAEREHVLVYV